MVKKRVSASIEESTVKLLDSLLKKRPFRNRSHIIEEAIKSFARKLSVK